MPKSKQKYSNTNLFLEDQSTYLIFKEIILTFFASNGAK